MIAILMYLFTLLSTKFIQVFCTEKYIIHVHMVTIERPTFAVQFLSNDEFSSYETCDMCLQNFPCLLILFYIPVHILVNFFPKNGF